MKRRLLAALLIIFIFAGCGLLIKEAVLDAREDIADKNYKDAIASLESVEKDMSGLTNNQKAEIYLLKALAFRGADRFEEAYAALEIVKNKYSDCDFSAQAEVLLKKWQETD